MGNKILTVIFLLLGHAMVQCQSYHNSHVLRKNKVKEIKTYQINSSQDSTLYVIEKINTKGKITEYNYVDKDGHSQRKIMYDYDFDTLIKLVKFYYKDTLHAIRNYYYDREGRETSYVGSKPNGRGNGARGETKYNKKGQVKETKNYERWKLISHIKYSYYDNGKEKEINVLKPNSYKRKIKFDKEGRIIKNDVAIDKIPNSATIPIKQYTSTGLIDYEYIFKDDGSQDILYKHYYIYY